MSQYKFFRENIQYNGNISFSKYIVHIAPRGVGKTMIFQEILNRVLESRREQRIYQNELDKEALERRINTFYIDIENR